MNNISTQAFVALQSFYGEVKAKFDEDRGAVMAEYGLLLALIAVMIIGTLVAFRDSLTSVFTSANTTLESYETVTATAPTTPPAP